MGRDHTEITEDGERMENYKSLREKQQTKRVIQAVLCALIPLGDLRVPASLSPTPRPRKRQHFVSRTGVQYMPRLEPSLARDRRAKLEILEPLR